MTIRRFLLVALGVVLAIAPMLGGCGEEGPEIPEEILIGCPAAVTGAASGFGEGGVFGYQAAVEDINTLGGIYIEEYATKIPVRLLVRDNESSPIKAKTLAEDLILADKVNFLVNVGPLDFNCLVAEAAETYKIVHMGALGPYESFMPMRDAAGGWDYTWEVSFAIATPAAEGDFRYGKEGYTMFGIWLGALESFLDQTNKKIALLAAADPDGTGWYHAFAGAAAGLGCDVYRATEEEGSYGLVPPDTTDFSSLINEWKAADCQLLWSNAPAPFFAAFWRQANTLEYQPKQVFATRSGLFYTDVNAWGGDLPNGVCNEMFWNPSIQSAKGIGNTTAMSLNDRWVAKTSQPLHQNVGVCYAIAQVLFDAVERAGTLNSTQVCEALKETNLMTMYDRVVFDKDQWSRVPVAFGQWQKTDESWKWDNPIVYSPHEFMSATADLMFPIPYD